jgi:hypothetical protein
MINDEEHHILPHTNIPQVVEAMRKAEEKRREALRGNRWDGERLWMGTSPLARRTLSSKSF